MERIILSVQAGSGGAESRAFAEMLLGAYTKLCYREGFEWHRTFTDGGGILRIEGECAWDFFAWEGGVHRLVRIPPFDEQKRRHTSFAVVSAGLCNDEESEQVRSYIFHPYKLAVDHRTGAETERVDEVLDGNFELLEAGHEDR